MPFELALTTDYATSTGSPEPFLARIARAGFRHVHWCHQWNTDFLYGPAELRAIARWMAELGLAMHDIHGSAGREKSWSSPRDHEREAGVELVANRVEMAHRLGCGVVIMHIPSATPGDADARPAWDAFRRSIGELQPVCRRSGVRLALENMAADNFDAITTMLSDYPPDYLGLCYDPGHGNIAGNGLDRLERLRHRLIALHLNDNDGQSDQHKPLFAGTVDWGRMAAIIAASGYQRPAMTCEVVIQQSGLTDEAAFLDLAMSTGQRFARMVEAVR